MGLVITPDILAKIKSKKIPKNSIQEINNYSNKNNNKKNNQKFIDIITNIYYPLYKKELKNFNENQKELLDNANNGNIINEINDFQKIKKNDNDEINNILFRSHKSIDLSINDFYKDLLLDSNNDIINTTQNYDHIKEDNHSDKDNESTSSDYADISREILEYKREKNKSKKRQNNKKELFSKKIRDSYYNKLIIKNQWNPLKKEKIVNNLFFFDWDDTLLCTSYFAPVGVLNDMHTNNISKKDKEIISNIDSSAAKLLTRTINMGYTFIITNGAPGWVELSSVKFYPKTAKVLGKVKIISARGLCEKKLPGDMRQWKTKAFKHALKDLQIRKDVPTNIICFGDSIIEMEASYHLKECFSNAYLKTIKFKESPSHSELDKELTIISSQLDSILTSFKNFSIKVTRKKND
jgi:FMN phosphatase YigB (HAD superfamily)